MRFRNAPFAVIVLLTVLGVSIGGTLRVQSADRDEELTLPPHGTRFHFEVVESFDAKYEGDTPGHVGRGGGLNQIRPHVALGDSVFQGDRQVGQITQVLWSRVQGSLTIEFDPLPDCRVAVGDRVSIDLNPEVSAGS